MNKNNKKAAREAELKEYLNMSIKSNRIICKITNPYKGEIVVFRRDIYEILSMFNFSVEQIFIKNMQIENIILEMANVLDKEWIREGKVLTEIKSVTKAELKNRMREKKLKRILK